MIILHVADYLQRDLWANWKYPFNCIHHLGAKPARTVCSMLAEQSTKRRYSSAQITVAELSWQADVHSSVRYCKPFRRSLCPCNSLNERQELVLFEWLYSPAGWLWPDPRPQLWVSVCLWSCCLRDQRHLTKSESVKLRRKQAFLKTKQWR